MIRLSLSAHKVRVVRVCNKTIILKYFMPCLCGKCDKIECILKIAAAVFLRYKSG